MNDKCTGCGAAFRATHISSSGVPRPTYECGRDGPNGPDTVPCLRRQLADEKKRADEIERALAEAIAEHQAEVAELLDERGTAGRERDEARAACVAMKSLGDKLEKAARQMCALHGVVGGSATDAADLWSKQPALPIERRGGTAEDAEDAEESGKR